MSKVVIAIGVLALAVLFIIMCVYDDTPEITWGESGWVIDVDDVSRHVEFGFGHDGHLYWRLAGISEVNDD